MCGINLIVSLKKDLLLNEKDKENLFLMNKLIAYRGPDNSDIYFSDYINFGHNRLSIVDNRTISNQPFLSTTGKSIIIFNGEIYNFKELRDKSLSAGYNFKTFSDTEVILALYEIWGCKGLDLLEGMFVFAIYDLNMNKIIIRRDRYGIKPFYYAVFKDKLYGSSEILPLIKVMKNKNLNNKALGSIFLFDNNCFEESILKNIFKLLPGNQIIYSDFSLEIKSWFKINSIKSNLNKCSTNLNQDLNQVLKKSVLKQSKTEVPTCIFFSGGIDSSLISYYSLKENSAIKLFSFLPSSITTRNNDILNAKERASLLGAKNFEYLSFEDSNLNKYLDLFSEKMYEPTSDAAIIPTMFLSDTARKQGFKVVLTGDGSDELFGGYSRYKFLANYSRISNFSKFFKTINNKLISRILLNSKYERLLNLFTSINSHKELYSQLLSVENIFLNEPNDFMKLSNQLKLDVISQHCSFLKIPKNRNNFSMYDSVSKADFTNLLPNQYLPKVDNSSMIFSLEARVPFLDDKVVNFVFGNREDLTLPNIKLKPSINKLAKNVLPKAFTNIAKQGYGIPIKSWLRGPLYDYLHSIKINDFEQFGFEVKNSIFQNELKKLRSGEGIDYKILNKMWKLVVTSKWIDNLNNI